MAESSPLDFFKTGTEILSAEDADVRMQICNGCPRLKFKVCQECGCFMPAKTRLGHAECPLGKW